MKGHEHKYISGTIGDECEFCGLMKSTIESIENQVYTDVTDINGKKIGSRVSLEGTEQLQIMPRKMNMKERITYSKKCFVCGELIVYILRDHNVNPLSDESAEAVISHKKSEKPGFDWCEKCYCITKQEIVSFDY